MKKKADHNQTAELLRRIAFAILLACLVGRAFIAELPFRANPINLATLMAQSQGQAETSVGPAADRTEIARMTFALLLLAAAAIWLWAEGIESNLKIKYPWLGVAVLLFTALSMLSVFVASDKRSAWDTWLEQTALLSAAFTAIQLCRCRRRFILLVIVVAALGATLAIKAIYQRVDEVPSRIAFFEANREKHLADMGIEPGDPKEKMLENRLRDTTVTGFLGMANLFAAELILMLAAGIGLAGAKILYAKNVKHANSSKAEKKPGEISPASISACLAVLAAAGMAVALAMTKSRGGIGAACLVTIVTVVLILFRKFLAKRWRATMIVIFALFLLGLAGVAGVGLSKDRLPSKTMTVRWFYWTGSAKIIADQPWLGVGPGNFAQAYMAVRRAQAEEEVKTPHNFIAHAFTQFGLPGGGVYITLLMVFLVLSARPGLGFFENEPLPDSANLRAKGNDNSRTVAEKSQKIPTDVIWTFALVVAAAFLTRWFIIAGGFDADVFFVIFDCLIPAILLAIMLAMSAWFGGLGKLENLPDRTIAVMRVALTAGAVGFVIHNLVSYGLWSAGPATAFWIVVGATAGAGGGKVWQTARMRWPIAGAGVLGVIVAGIVIAGPVYRRSMHTEELAQAISAKNLPRARVAAGQAVDADPLDALARMNCAKILSLAPTGQAAQTDLQDALAQARRAMEIDPKNSASARLAGQIADRIAQEYSDIQARSQAADFFARAVELDPANARLRLEYARVLVQAGEVQQANQQIDTAEELNGLLLQFDPENASQFSEKEFGEIRNLRNSK